MLFVLCHIGEMFVSFYEMVLYYVSDDDTSSHEFPDWVRNLIVINHILIVANSSLNFAIYCKDLVFRQCVTKIYRALVCTNGNWIENPRTAAMTGSVNRFLSPLRQNLGRVKYPYDPEKQFYTKL